MAKRAEAVRQVERDFSPQQLTAIELLVQGKGKAATAEAVGVAPYTVSRWYQDASFVAALNSRRLEVHESNAERLRVLAGKAIDALEQALESEDMATRLKAASLVLKAVSLAEIKPPEGPRDAEEVEIEWANQRSNRRLRRLLSADDGM